MEFKELKTLYHDAVLTEVQLSDLESEIPDNCGIGTASYETGIICIGENENGELFRFEACQYELQNTETGEKFYFYG